MILFDTFTLQEMDPRDWSIDSTTGFLLARPRVARTGIQIYRGIEVDPEGEHFAADAQVRVYRPEEEVFNKDSMATYAYRPVTNDHPKKFVDAKTWKEVSVGGTGGEVARDGEYIRLPIMVQDYHAVNDMKAGKKQFSMGYGCKIDWTSGVIPANAPRDAGEAFDCIQKTIRVNHTAVCDVARGGPDLGLDSDATPEDEGDDDMATGDARIVGAAPLLLPMLVDSLQIHVPDAQTQSIIAKALADRDKLVTEGATALKVAQDALAAAQTKAATDATTAKEALDKATAEVATLKKAVEDNTITPAKLQAAAKAYNDTISIARQVMGDGFDPKDLDAAGIRKAVVQGKMGDTAKGWTDAQIETSFATMTAGMTPTADTGAGGGNRGYTPPGGPGFFGAPGGQGRPANAMDVAAAFGRPVTQMTDADKAYAESCWLTSNGWRGRQWCDANNPYTKKAA